MSTINRRKVDRLTRKVRKITMRPPGVGVGKKSDFERQLDAVRKRRGK
jgi:hypothetical protein